MASAPLPSSVHPSVDNPLEFDNALSPSSSKEVTPTSSPALSRSTSFVGSNEDWGEVFPPLDKLTVFDFLDQFALPQKLERINEQINRKIQFQSESLKKHRDKVKLEYVKQKERVIKKTDVEFEKYRKRYSQGLEKVLDKWDDTRVVSTREKISFVVGVCNIFITGFLIGGYPEWVHVWYSVQLLYFMPIRYFTYHKRGYQYFLADLCYFVNLLLLLNIWVFPNSRRLMISTYCLAYGNNAWAIAMWRNSLVFHSLDKVTSLFIHIMPPVVLHCLVHLLDQDLVDSRFPSISRVKGVEKYGLIEMVIWATVPYGVWQLSYHLFITVRRREKIAAGRPTSFTWLRKTYSKTWIGKLVLRLPETMQEPAFMLIQYSYAVLTMLPCPFWFYHSSFSALFLTAVGLWSIYNGATFYIDVFGKRFQNELEQLKKDVAKWQNSPLLNESNGGAGHMEPLNLTTKTTTETTAIDKGEKKPDGSEVRERSITSSVTIETS
ncbi:unnamed protein product [Tuber melanosporum]|uniref:Glycerophosphocholine acyltransferase 1 n=1 Tax=Tuber melanosporum (strain Mel28) TaxID=656061 RepID=D5GKS0_TUBMM|nr:uncharacterized protein GSTUM_00009736001 [Tuber melanosporum]CAZ85113.1 unnamed protein product [Tuber melanosporum]